MADANMDFKEALSRLEEIAAKVNGDDISLDESLDLLEEGVKLANICAENTDYTCLREETETADANRLPG